jgi:broad specificity phosphatase PhoE
MLRQGGLILYARHGEATVGLDQPNFNFQNCFTQRNLSEVGRRQAAYYGATLRNLQIPISVPVLASPFCRTIETGQLAFERWNVQIDPFWFQVYRLSRNLSYLEQNRILNALKSRLEINPPQGSNTAIIAHSFPQGIGLGQIDNMETVVVRPLGRGRGYEIIDTLSLDELVNL